ncbi:MAG TPA: T6SS effector BTH_I2691 family protein [Noviherbaspirillum sp.]|nr:T6SS effector BTH_I2691 family protein [Noviherbaspirillum sp.]
MTNAKNNCDTCNKSTLSLLLLRPSPIAKRGELVPPGTSAVISDDAATAGLLPKRLPTESRFALRLLRAGYVHVYIANPPPGMKHWLVYRVTEQADLVPESSEWFKQPTNVACTSNNHNIIGMKLLNIPQAHKISEIWIAYSANLWNDTSRSRNRANPEVMQKVALAESSPNTFQPTAANLKSKVLECALASLRISQAVDHDFTFSSMASHVDKLAEQLVRAAACHPKTKGKEMAVVLRDPIGIAAELNALRLRRHELAKKEIEKPQNAHPLNSSNALMGLKSVILDANQLDSYEQVSPLRTKAKFDSETWPAGTEWQALTAEDRKMLVQRSSGSVLLKPYKDIFERSDMGRVIYPDHDERAAAWARKKTEATWSKMAPHYDESERARWVKTFEDRMKAAHYNPLANFEEDWRTAADDERTLAYFKSHFDPHDPNDPLKHHSPGRVYAQENQYINTPAPITTGATLDTYLAMLDKPITDESAVVLRALTGNQKAVIDEVHIQLTGDAGTDGMRDKTYDFLKGLGELKKGGAVLKKYSWMGDTLAAFSVGQLTALGGAVLSAAARHPEIGISTTRAFGKLQHLWGIQQALELAVQGAVQGQAPKVPVLLTMKVSADDALAVLRARHGQALGTSKSRIKRHRANGIKISLTLLTDTDSLKTVQGNVSALTKDPATGSVKLGQPAAISAMTAATGSSIVLSEQQFLRLYAQQASLGTKAVNAVRQALAGAAAKDVRAIAMTMEGRLAIGSLMAQGIGLINGLHALDNAKTANEVRDAWYGIYDSTAGTLGGLLQMWAVAVDVRTVAQAGEQVAAKSVGLGALRFMANIAGAAGGAVNAVGAWAKKRDASKNGDTNVATLYKYSNFAFVGTAATSTMMAAGVAADTLIARGVGGAVIRTIAVRVGASGVLATVGGTALTVSGIGLVLLGAGMALQIGAIALTPTPMQRWISRSYFGKDPGIFFDGKRDDMFPKGNWKMEFEALQKAIRNGAEEESTQSNEPVAQDAAMAQ